MNNGCTLNRKDTKKNCKQHKEWPQVETKFTEEFTRLLVMKQEKNQHENHKQAMTNLHCNKDVQMQALTNLLKDHHHRYQHWRKMIKLQKPSFLWSQHTKRRNVNH
ncbi:hypothetical protein JHK87_031402 [Glycine soja]|nr:hypothetical protein JHK87_031402 [Glycine soja]